MLNLERNEEIKWYLNDAEEYKQPYEKEWDEGLKIEQKQNKTKPEEREEKHSAAGLKNSKSQLIWPGRGN